MFDAVNQRRKMLGYTWRALEAQAGVTRQAVRAWGAGTSPTWRKLAGIAQALGCEVAELVGQEREERDG